MMLLMTTEVHNHVGPWSLPLPFTFVVVLTALVYLRGWVRVRSTFPGMIPVWRVGAFFSGVALVWIAAGSPLSVLDHQLLTFHMIDHLMLMTLAAPLILIGAPGLLLPGLRIRFDLRAQEKETRLASLPVQLLRRLLRFPPFAWIVATTTVIGWHLPSVFEMTMASPWWHGLEYGCFFVAGLLFWWPVIRSTTGASDWPRWYVPVYLFLATLPCDILSAFLVFCGRVVYPSYLSAPRLLSLSPLNLSPLSLSPLEDQQCAGALMWVWVTFAYLLPAVVITMQMLSPQKVHSPHLNGLAGTAAHPR